MKKNIFSVLFLLLKKRPKSVVRIFIGTTVLTVLITALIITGLIFKDEYKKITNGFQMTLVFDDNIAGINVNEIGKAIRYNKEYKDTGTNVNFVQLKDKGIEIRTYERGVENETLACGTGAVASAISYYIKYRPDGQSINVKTSGGDLQVSFKENENKYTEIYLTGPAKFVFEGQIELQDN